MRPGWFLFCPKCSRDEPGGLHWQYQVVEKYWVVCHGYGWLWTLNTDALKDNFLFPVCSGVFQDQGTEENLNEHKKLKRV